ncbi:hypothetical protein GCM10025868_21640 [Angustibacter aerolatus]|uniref:Nudix hydrolase domain-containing protein n=1 Tax=Angustibacter aerolatus TaxID=1162965 RepID=A0ABQ6JII6_9ACTN|nr:hypothetical protein GCM10025868_21640 [Angustibacter aerolatus]
MAGHQQAVEDLADLSDEQFDETYRTNVYGLFWLVKAALPHLQPGASVITTSSVQAYQPSPTLVDYAGTKAAINAISKALAQQARAQGRAGQRRGAGSVLDAAAGERRPADRGAARLRCRDPARPRRAAGRAWPRRTCTWRPTARAYTTGATVSVTGGMPTPDPLGRQSGRMSPNPPGTPGVDVPDARGRTGLDRAGRDLTRNPDVVVRDVEVLSDGWHVLRRTTLDVRRRDGGWETQQRETYARGDGAVILLHDVERRTVLLSRQFRWPVYVNGHPDGMLVEAAAGLLDEDDPETAIRREAAEEPGCRGRRA